MSVIKVEDVCIWTKHIEGNDALKTRLFVMDEGTIVVLKIGSSSGSFRKMRQGENPNPTPGLRPACDATNDWWKSIYAQNKGKRLPIREVTE